MIQFDPCQDLTLVVDPAATEAELAGVAAGLGTWNRSVDAQLSIAAVAPPAPAAALPVHFQTAAPPFHGFYDDQIGEIFINTDLADREQAITIAHEIGHAFGLLHVGIEQRPSLMNPGNLDVDVTAGDVDALAALWGRCPLPGTATAAPGTAGTPSTL